MDQETLTNGSSSALQSLRQPGHLPSKIFTEILLLTLPPLPERQAPKLEVLSLVCRFWHLLVDSSPALWSRISIADNISHVQRAISKSGEHPIDVWGESATLDPGAFYLDDRGPSRFLAKVQPHAQRWRHVTLQLPPTYGSTPAPAILPSLQTLRLRSWHNSVLSDQLLALLNRQHVPFLRELSVCGLRITRWELISLPPTLSKLELSPTIDDPFIVGWLSIIAACPNLAVFRVCSTGSLGIPGVAQMGGENGIAPAVVELNALRKLDLDGIHPDLIIDLLMRLRLPEDCAISIECRLESPNPSTSFLSPALSSQRNFLRAGNARQVAIVLNGGFYLSACLRVVYQRWRIALSFPEISAVRNALDWFSTRGEDSNASSSHPGILQAGLATSNSLPVTLELGEYWFGLNHTQLGAISDLRNINRIEMNNLGGGKRRDFLLYLSAPEDSNQPTRTMADPLQTPEPQSKQEVAGVWPFPGLSELVWREESKGVYRVFGEEPKDKVVHTRRVLVEPITGQCSDDAATGTSGRATRAELRPPNTLCTVAQSRQVYKRTARYLN